jgi:hypothetical protein
MRQVGFRKVVAYVGGRGFFLRSPLLTVRATELALRVLPRSLQRALAGTLLFLGVLGVRLIGTN